MYYSMKAHGKGHGVVKLRCIHVTAEAWELASGVHERRTNELWSERGFGNTQTMHMCIPL